MAGSLASGRAADRSLSCSHGTCERGQNFTKKMLESRPEDALVNTVETVEIVETVLTAETVEMVETVELCRLKI